MRAERSVNGLVYVADCGARRPRKEPDEPARAILAPVFAWNHDQVMREGGRAIAQHLGVALLAFQGSSGNRE